MVKFDWFQISLNRRITLSSIEVLKTTKQMEIDLRFSSLVKHFLQRWDVTIKSWLQPFRHLTVTKRNNCVFTVTIITCYCYFYFYLTSCGWQQFRVTPNIQAAHVSDIIKLYIWAILHLINTEQKHVVSSVHMSNAPHRYTSCVVTPSQVTNFINGLTLHPNKYGPGSFHCSVGNSCNPVLISSDLPPFKVFITDSLRPYHHHWFILHNERIVCVILYECVCDRQLLLPPVKSFHRLNKIE